MKCNRVALIQDGLLLSIDNPEKIRKGFTRKLFSARANEKYKLLNALREYRGILSAYPFGDSVHITFHNDKFDDSLFEHLKKAGIENTIITETEAGIEDRFLELMKGIKA